MKPTFHNTLSHLKSFSRSLYTKNVTYCWVGFAEKLSYHQPFLRTNKFNRKIDKLPTANLLNTFFEIERDKRFFHFYG